MAAPATSRNATLTQAVGLRIALLRREGPNGPMTQEGLAERAGISKSTLERFERGLSSPRLDRLGWIAGALGVSLHDIICDGARSTTPVELARLEELVQKHKASAADTETVLEIVDAVLPAIQRNRSRRRGPHPSEQV